MIKQQVIWITGASSGIGKALTLQLSDLNNQLIISSRNKRALEDVKKKSKHPKNIKILPIDLANYKQLQAKVEIALSFFNRVDILINNGGVSQRSLISETDIEVDKHLIEVNYLGTVALSKALLPYFIKNKSGCFVTVTSLMGKFGSPYRSGYCGSKHALHGFFDVLRMEHEKDNINVTLVCPGFVNTNIARNALNANGETQKSQDEATENGLDVNVFAKKMIKAIAQKKFEVNIGKGEVRGVYLKRFFPKLLHKIVLKHKVR